MRLFDEHYKRKQFLLDGMWDFASGEGFEIKLNKNPMKVTVPSCINQRLGFMDFNSVCGFRKDFYAHGAITIKFYAVTEYARVYLDGKFLGDHYGGFSAFEFDTVVNEGMHTLLVTVDPRSGEDTIPQWEVDWFHYCGIIRSVEVSEFANVAIKSLRVDYTLDDELKNADATVKVRLKNFYDADIEKQVKIDIDGKVIFDEKVSVRGELEISAPVHIDSVRLWDVRKPELYTVRVQTDDDDLTDKIGFRKIETRGRKIYLNNKPIKFLGVNRHECHPDWGFAMPAALDARDMDILNDLGVNTVRGSHYPNTQLFVDMCDANGIMFWSEIPMWGFKAEALARPLVIERGLAMHREMIEQYRNHPSIVIWGLHNEVATDTCEGYAVTKEFSELVRSLDNTRLVTYATNRAQKDICLKFADIICINRYIGWYDGKLPEWQEFVDSTKKYFESVGVGDKPIVMSEFGVGAMYGTRGFDDLKWSENYQCEFYRKTLDLFLNDDDMSGVYLWQFCDIRSNADWSLLRARSFNNKGLLNEHRQPKLAYYTVKEIFENERNKRRNS